MPPEIRDQICQLAIGMCLAEDEAEKKTIPAEEGLGAAGAPTARWRANNLKRQLKEVVRNNVIVA